MLVEEKEVTIPVKAASQNMSLKLKDVDREDLNRIFEITKATTNTLEDDTSEKSFNRFYPIKRTGRILNEDLSTSKIDDENLVIDIVSSRYHVVNHDQIFNSVLDVIEDNGIKYSIANLLVDQRIGSNKMYANISLDELSIDVDGSMIKPTIDIFNSTDGKLAAGIMFGAYRFKCMNGMIIGEDFINQRMVHTPSIINKLNFDEVFDNLLVKFKHLGEQIEQMQSIKFNKIMMDTLTKVGFDKMFIKNYDVIVEKYMLNNSEVVDKNTLWGVYATATNYISNHRILKNINEGIKMQQRLNTFVKQYKI